MVLAFLQLGPVVRQAGLGRSHGNQPSLPLRGVGSAEVKALLSRDGQVHPLRV